MALTASTMLPLGTIAPNFELSDTISEKSLNLQQLKSDKATVIMFICNHCPFVKHVQEELVRLANDYQQKGIAFIAISANDPTDYPEDAPEQMRKVAQELNYSFPYLFDATQDIAKAYQAACTPDFYIFDKDLKCVYRGQLDDSRPGKNIPVDGKAIRTALDNMLAGKPISAEQKPSVGCNIKWRKSDAI